MSFLVLGEQGFLDEKVLGASAHSDYGMITLLVSDGVPGLQARALFFMKCWLAVICSLVFDYSFKIHRYAEKSLWNPRCGRMYITLVGKTIITSSDNMKKKNRTVSFPLKYQFFCLERKKEDN